MAILHPISLENLVAEVGTKHSHQILLKQIPYFYQWNNLHKCSPIIWHHVDHSACKNTITYTFDLRVLQFTNFKMICPMRWRWKILQTTGYLDCHCEMTLTQAFRPAQLCFHWPKGLRQRHVALEPQYRPLTQWGRVTHICVRKRTIIGLDNDMSPERRQAIIWTNVKILLIGPLETNASEIWIKIYTFSLNKIHSKIWSGNW